jgi:hypothetical protein
LTTLFRSVCVEWLLIDRHTGTLHFTQLPFIYHHLIKLQFSREAKLMYIRPPIDPDLVH